MKHEILKYKIQFFLTIGFFLLLIPVNAYGSPIGSNSWHVNSPFQAKNNADIVCKIKVHSIRQQGVIKNNFSPVESDACRMIARSNVISVIKGKCPQIIDIEFQYPLDKKSISDISIGQIFTGLSKNEVCIVFLKHEKSFYKLNRINSKLRIQPKAIEYNLGDTPNLRLLAECLAGCNSQNELIQLQAIEELGYLGNTMIHQIYQSPYLDNKQVLQRCIEIDSALKKARVTIKKMYSSSDVVLKNMSVIASFQLGVSPGIEKPLALLRMNPSDFDPNDSLKKYGIPDFCIASLQLRLLQTMDFTTRRFLVNLKDQSVIMKASGSYLRGVPDFDYIEFAKQAAQYKVVKDSKEMRSAISHILWITDDRYIR